MLPSTSSSRKRSAHISSIDRNPLEGAVTKKRTSTRLANKARATNSFHRDNGGSGKKSLHSRSKLNKSFKEDPDSATTPMKEARFADRSWILKDDDDTSTLTSLCSSDLNDMEDNIYGTPTPKPVTRAQVARPARRAAKVALRKVREINKSAAITPVKPLRLPPTPQIDPEITEAARIFLRDRPVAPKLNPLPLSRDRITIDKRNVILFAEEGASDLWGSALSSSRFGGPRRHPPWRELHRLTDPDPSDMSDWAENIRWAKEQWQLYGSVWTEYDYSLEVIREHRMASMWVSEEVIGGGQLPK